MTKTKRTVLGFLGAFLLLALPVAQAQDAPGPGGPAQKEHFEKHIQGIFSQLSLTDDQKDRLEANKKQQRAKMEAVRQELRQDREEFQKELMKPDLDMARIYAIHNRVKSLQDRMEDDRLGSILTVRSILTREQFLKFVGLMKKHEPQH